MEWNGLFLWQKYRECKFKTQTKNHRTSVSLWPSVGFHHGRWNRGTSNLLRPCAVAPPLETALLVAVPTADRHGRERWGRSPVNHPSQVSKGMPLTTAGPPIASFFSGSDLTSFTSMLLKELSLSWDMKPLEAVMMSWNLGFGIMVSGVKVARLSTPMLLDYCKQVPI